MEKSRKEWEGVGRDHLPTKRSGPKKAKFSFSSTKYLMLPVIDGDGQQKEYSCCTGNAGRTSLSTL